MNQQEEILSQTVIADENPKPTLAEKLREEKKQKRKKNIKYGAIAAVVFFIGYSIWFLVKPFKASAEYGICRTFLELTLPYPHTLYVSELNFLRQGRGLKLWYTHTDAFGEYRMESFVCTLAIDSETGRLAVANIKLNKVNMEASKVAQLNHALVMFETNPLILNYPTELPDSLGALHFDFDVFRKVQLDTKKYGGL